MNVIENILQELRDENLIDNFEQFNSAQDRNSNIPNIYSQSISLPIQAPPSQLTKVVAESLQKQSEMRYSTSTISNNQTPFLPQPRMRLIKKQSKFSRICKCCRSYVFIFDAYCPICSERLVGNFFYYLFFLISASMIGFMVFYMATANPY